MDAIQDARGCRIILVGSTFLAGTYLALACPHQSVSSDMLAVRRTCDCVPTRLKKHGGKRSSASSDTSVMVKESVDSGKGGAVTWEEESRSTVEFVQLLLETYRQVVAMTCGSVALSSLIEPASGGAEESNLSTSLSMSSLAPATTTTRGASPATVLLIDIDHLAHTHADILGVNGNAPGGQHPGGAKRTDSGITVEDMYALDFLRAISNAITNGRLPKNTYPIVCSRTSSPELVMHCLDLGAVDYLVKPIGEETARNLWLRATKQSSRKMQRDGSSGIQRADGKLAELIIQHYSGPFRPVHASEFPTLDRVAAEERYRQLRIRVRSWDFCPHDFSDDDLLRIVVSMMEDVIALPGLEDVRISRDDLLRFTIILRDAYHSSNPYHNFHHGVDVLQSMFYFLREMGLIDGMSRRIKPVIDDDPVKVLLQSATTGPDIDEETRRALYATIRPLDILAWMVASIGHDVGHPGVNNVFLINARNPLAQLYNDRAVLENYHATSLFYILQRHEISFFHDRDLATEFRRCVVSTILATDMSQHFDYVRRFGDLVDRLASGGTNAIVPDLDQSLIGAALIKCADISNPARSFRIAEIWSKVLLREFATQAGLERQHGFPVAFPTADDHNRLEQAKSQVGFISALAAPLFNSVTEVVPELGFLKDIITGNKAAWERIRDEEMMTVKNAYLKMSDASLASKHVLSTGSPRQARSMLRSHTIDGIPSSTGASPSMVRKVVEFATNDIDLGPPAIRLFKRRDSNGSSVASIHSEPGGPARLSRSGRRFHTMSMSLGNRKSWLAVMSGEEEPNAMPVGRSPSIGTLSLHGMPSPKLETRKMSVISGKKFSDAAKMFAKR